MPREWDGRDRRKLSDEQEAIAQRAADIAFEKFYAEVGKSMVKKFLWIVGAVTVALLMWLGGKGISLK